VKLRVPAGRLRCSAGHPQHDSVLSEKETRHAVPIRGHARRRPRLAAPAAAQTRLNVAIGADVNVVEVNKSVLGPGFKALAPDVDLNVVGTGTGEPASRAIYTKIKAQADAGRKPWDIDVALVSMAVARRW
jgi:hypothetical protein